MPTTRWASLTRTAPLVITFLFFASANADAQVVVDPTILEFKPSSDHNTITNGVPLVSGYQFEMYRPGASAPFQTTPLGKPAVNPQGFVRLSLGALLVPLPSAGIEYTAKVSAVGPGGRAGARPRTSSCGRLRRRPARTQLRRRRR